MMQNCAENPYDMLLSFLRKILKVGVALVAVEATSLCGIWKDSASTIAGYENAKHSALAVIVPQIRPYLNKVCLFLPSAI